MLTFRAIVDAVCEETGFTRPILWADRRQQPVVTARAMVWWLARRHTMLSYPQMGRYSGSRDHTTILQALRTFEHRLEADPQLRARVARLDRGLTLAAEALEMMGIVEADVDPLAVATTILQSPGYRRATTISVREIVALAEAVAAAHAAAKDADHAPPGPAEQAA